MYRITNVGPLVIGVIVDRKDQGYIQVGASRDFFGSVISVGPADDLSNAEGFYELLP